MAGGFSLQGCSSKAAAVGEEGQMECSTKRKAEVELEPPTGEGLLEGCTIKRMAGEQAAGCLKGEKTAAAVAGVGGGGEGPPAGKGEQHLLPRDSTSSSDSSGSDSTEDDEEEDEEEEYVELRSIWPEYDYWKGKWDEIDTSCWTISDRRSDFYVDEVEEEGEEVVQEVNTN